MSEELDVELLFKQNTAALMTLRSLLDKMDELKELLEKAIGQLEGTEEV